MKKIVPIIAGIAMGTAFGTVSVSVMSHYINNTNSMIAIDSSSVNAIDANANIDKSDLMIDTQSSESSKTETTSKNTTRKTTNNSTIASTTKSNVSINIVTKRNRTEKTFNDSSDTLTVDGAKIGTTQLTGEKVIYLTFDDGPSELTPKILDILDKYNVKATFFVTGFDKDNSKYIKLAHDKDHTIGMHTYSHDYSYVYSSADNYYKDLNKIAELCKEQIGYVPHYIRFPGGSSNTISAQYKKGIMKYLTKDIHKHGYQYYDWNSANNDAMGGITTAKYLYKSAVSFAGQSDLVMLCHDSADKTETVKSLPKIIQFYKKQGYVFRGIDDKSYVAHHEINN